MNQQQQVAAQESDRGGQINNQQYSSRQSMIENSMMFEDQH